MPRVSSPGTKRKPVSRGHQALLRERRRRLAVVGEGGRLLGLLCLKKDGTGYCSDEGIWERALQARSGSRDQVTTTTWTPTAS